MPSCSLSKNAAPPKTYGQKFIVELELENSFNQPIESARAEKESEMTNDVFLDSRMVLNAISLIYSLRSPGCAGK